jgi:hypothetical protein
VAEWQTQRIQKPEPAPPSETIEPDSAGLEKQTRGDQTASGPLPPRNAAASEPTDAELKQALVAAMLEGRGAVAELLAEELKGRRLERAGVPSLGERRNRRR